VGRGRFITIEGPEGAGKTTQAGVIAAALRALGSEVVVTREPGGTPLGDAIRALLLGPGGEAISHESESLLFAAARAQHVRDVIGPALAGGRDVVCDRFSDSSMAYQGGGLGLDTMALEAIQRFAIGDVRPDLKLLLDLPVEAGLARRMREGEQVNHVDRRSVAFHRRVRDMYLRLVSESPSTWVVIDASRPVGEVSEAVHRLVTGRTWSDAPS